MTKKQKNLLTRILLGAVALLGGAVLTHVLEDSWACWIGTGLLLASWLLCGLEVAVKAIRNIGHGQVFDEDFLMTLATVGAFALGDFAEGAAVMLFFQVGELVNLINLK